MINTILRPCLTCPLGYVRGAFDGCMLNCAPYQEWKSTGAWEDYLADEEEPNNLDDERIT